MPHVESMHKSYCNDPRCYMDENPYGDYLSRWEQTKDDSCILQDEYESNKWANVKIDLINNENFNTKQDHRAEKDSPKTNYNISLTKK